MSITNNPFYVLGVSLNDNRRQIMSKADELSFEIEGTLCTECQNILINPAKRLTAEFDWFLTENISNVYESIKKYGKISTDGLDSISKLNALLYNLGLEKNPDYLLMGWYVLELNDAIVSFDADAVKNAINSARNSAGFPRTEENDILNEIKRKRSEIKQVINGKLSSTPKEEYQRFIDIIALKHLHDDADSVPVLLDLIEQYEIDNNDRINELAECIEKSIEKIKNSYNTPSFEMTKTDLINEMEKWFILVYPIQRKSSLLGMADETSSKIENELRGLTLFLNNEKGNALEAFNILCDTKDYFEGTSEIYNVLYKDCKALRDILLSEEDAKEIVEMMKKVEDISKHPSMAATEEKVDDFIDLTERLFSLIEYCDLDSDTKNNLLRNLFYCKREVAIKLYNDYHKTRYSERILRSLLDEYRYDDALFNKAKYDMTILLNNQFVEHTQHNNQSYSVLTDKEKKIIAIAAAGIFAVIILITCIVSATSLTISAIGPQFYEPICESAKEYLMFVHI